MFSVWMAKPSGLQAAMCEIAGFATVKRVTLTPKKRHRH